MASVSSHAAAGHRRAYPAQLVELLFRPARALPELESRQGTLALIGFPAVSGIFVAYTLAKGLAAGDSFGLAGATVLVVAGGALLGMLALWFAGSLPNWSVPESDAEEAESAQLYWLFSEATWPFLPLLLIIVPLDLYYHGTTIFSAVRDTAPAGVTWLMRGLMLTAIALWLIMMVRGTAVLRHESERRAAGELVRWGAELVAIAVLFALILGVSLMYW